MLNNKIARKLSVYFTVSLLVFAMVIGGVFVLLFKNHTVELHKTELVERASSIASTLSEYMGQRDVSGDAQHNKGSKGGYGAYLRFIGDIAMTDVWIVDEQRNLITGGMGHGAVSGTYNYSDLPQNAESLIKEVFNDQTVFSQDFSDVLSELTLTIGVPIETGGEVVGVVLLHSPVHGTDAAIADGFSLLVISILAALTIAILLSIGFSITFTKPLGKMKNVALKLASGEYTAKTNIKQNDEIGQLASTMDVLAQRLDDASQQSVELEQMRQDFVANISHELRTPVTVMRGSLEALVDKVITDPVQIENYHKQMLAESLFLQRLVGDLLDLSRLQSTDFAIEKQELSICDLIDDATRSAHQIAVGKGVIIRVDQKNQSCVINGDYGRLRQMIMIVLDNAIKFSPENGTVDVVFENNILSIRDYGIGIPKQELSHIFDRFYKSRSEQNKTGTGLGLAIAQQIAQRHDIHLTAQSNETEGTVFQFEFPYNLCWKKL